MSATGSVLLDTSVVIAYFRKGTKLQKQIEQFNDIYLPLVVLGELYYGAYKSTRQAKMLAEVSAFSKGCILIFPTEATAEHYGRIKAALSTIGKPIPQNDIWIAAAAKEYDLPVATQDQHFSLVSGLTVLQW
jgi:tRNA(fMet)-specific endonuclease VapC